MGMFSFLRSEFCLPSCVNDCVHDNASAIRRWQAPFLNCNSAQLLGDPGDARLNLRKLADVERKELNPVAAAAQFLRGAPVGSFIEIHHGHVGMPLSEFPATPQADSQAAHGYHRNFVLKIHDRGFSFLPDAVSPVLVGLRFRALLLVSYISAALN
jgi:hypothetical protein